MIVNYIIKGENSNKLILNYIKQFSQIKNYLYSYSNVFIFLMNYKDLRDSFLEIERNIKVDTYLLNIY